MGHTYFKRFRMEIDLLGHDFSDTFVPWGYHLEPWGESLLEAHAIAKCRSFHTEIDANVFPSLSNYEGCLRLMEGITRKEEFLPEATWLVKYVGTSYDSNDDVAQYCGTIQGLRDQSGQGAVQNLGIAAEHRNRGLGTLLMKKTLEGFQRVGLRQAYLEVTSQNLAAVNLYLRLGFTKTRTIYKASEVPSVAGIV